MEIKPRIIVRMNGEEFITWREKNKIRLTNKVIGIILIISSVLLLMVLLAFMFDTPKSPSPIQYINLFGQHIPYPVIMLLLLGLVIGWSLHGVGFTIIKR